MSKCWYCGIETSPFPKEGLRDPAAHGVRFRRYAVADHVKPLSRGGRDSKANRVNACFACNRHKSNMTLAEYRDYLDAKSRPGKALRQLLSAADCGVLPADLLAGVLRAADYLRSAYPPPRFAGEGAAA